MIKPIQTRYAGFLFRSRLEARWAVFFDALKLDWQYEPEGFQLKSGTYYLPDFRISFPKGGHLWVEIKPDGVTSSQLLEFIRSAPFNSSATILHEIPDPRERYYGHEIFFGNNDDTQYDAGCDDNYMFCICKTCLRAGFEFGASVERMKCACIDPAADTAKVIAAFAKARAARFEHEDREVYANV